VIFYAKPQARKEDTMPEKKCDKLRRKI